MLMALMNNVLNHVSSSYSQTLSPFINQAKKM